MKIIRSLLLGTTPFCLMVVGYALTDWYFAPVFRVSGLFTALFAIPLSFWGAFGIADSITKHTWWNLFVGFAMAALFLILNVTGLGVLRALVARF